MLSQSPADLEPGSRVILLFKSHQWLLYTTCPTTRTPLSSQNLLSTFQHAVPSAWNSLLTPLYPSDLHQLSVLKEGSSDHLSVPSQSSCLSHCVLTSSLILAECLFTSLHYRLTKGGGCVVFILTSWGQEWKGSGVGRMSVIRLATEQWLDGSTEKRPSAVR